MGIRITVVINESEPGSWSEWVWSDINRKARILLDNNNLKNGWLKKIKKIHFSNQLNKKIWIPFKSIWDRSLSLQIDDLNSEDSNYIIFQSNIKFSPKHIRKLKTKKNARIILYLPDTTSAIGIGKTAEDISRYCGYYLVDQVFSFDKQDCAKFGFSFFDYYSCTHVRSCKEKKGLFYVGSCRNEERRDLLIKIYEHLNKRVNCDFHLVGVSADKQVYAEKIDYNNPMVYSEVISNLGRWNCILELVNENQTGNTLRFKEAICYNKKLITNNPFVLDSKYYNPEWILYFNNIEEISSEWILKDTIVDYKYSGEYSPNALIDIICGEKHEIH